MQTMTVEEFRASLIAQGVKREDFAFVCPMCKTVQSARDLMRAGAGDDFEAVEKYLAFSCVGRFTNAGSPRRHPDGNPCNWTLGGLLSAHELVVIDEDGTKHPRFTVATPEQAQAHAQGIPQVVEPPPAEVSRPLRHYQIWFRNGGMGIYYARSRSGARYEAFRQVEWPQRLFMEFCREISAIRVIRKGVPT